ncbi:MAG: hypothetical protein J6D37_02800 [Clostridia bacterium]|nr:hypothetical protein [Clostridia bacterium]
MPKYADTSLYTCEENALWALLIKNQGKIFYTAKGLPFGYQIVGNEMFVDRKEKSITRSSVNASYRKAKTLMATFGRVAGPKELGTFGASYLFPVFLELSLIQA